MRIAMNQDQTKKTQGQAPHGQQSGAPHEGNKPQMTERRNPSTTERIQPEPNRGQRQEGDKPTGSQQPKF
jgi:hypothetical protein